MVHCVFYLQFTGVAREGCTGCTCTPRSRTKNGALFRGVSCKCMHPPRESEKSFLKKICTGRGRVGVINGLFRRLACILRTATKKVNNFWGKKRVRPAGKILGTPICSAVYADNSPQSVYHRTARQFWLDAIGSCRLSNIHVRMTTHLHGVY